MWFFVFQDCNLLMFHVLSFSTRLCRIKELGDKLRGLDGCKRQAAAFLLGIVAAFTYAPIGAFPLLWICFPALILLLQGTRNPLGAFLTGWSFAFGYFVTGLYWIAASMFVDIRQFWWAVPLAVAGLPAFLSIYYGLAAATARWMGLRGLRGALTFSLFWFLADYARGYLFTGFPWNLEGYGWFRVLPMMQIVSVIGTYGLTVITVTASCLPACLVEPKLTHKKVVIGSLITLILIAGWGEWRLENSTYDQRSVHNYVRIVQPNIEQAHKWILSEREKHFKQLLNMTAASSQHPIDVVVWPETASTFYLTEDSFHRQLIASALPPRSVLLTGVIRHDFSSEGPPRFFNSLVVVDSNGLIVGFYDKAHLVPFGEYIPFRQMLPLRPLVSMATDFSHGTGPKTLHLQDKPSFSPFICYEAIFPGFVADRRDRPAYLVNITNDGWYGHTAGPYQHFAIVRFRAVEEGLPLVRAANTGISGIIDSFGRIKSYLGLGVAGAIDGELPPTLPPTLYVRYGDIPLWLILALKTVIIVCLRYRNK